MSAKKNSGVVISKAVVGAIKWLLAHKLDLDSTDEVLAELDLLCAYIYEEIEK